MKRVRYLTCLSGNDGVIHKDDTGVIADEDAARLLDQTPPMVEILGDVEEPVVAKAEVKSEAKPTKPAKGAKTEKPPVAPPTEPVVAKAE